jgi:integrase
MRRFDPAGQPLPADAYVFGNEIGQRVKDIGRAFETAVLKAHGHKATVTATCNLTAEARAQLAAVDLHFHDLRREAGSRWLDGGVPLSVIKDWLGHGNISQTSTYLASTMRTQHDAMAAFEARRESLQNLANGSKTGGRKSPPPAGRRGRKPNKTGTRHERPTMQ